MVKKSTTKLSDPAPAVSKFYQNDGKARLYITITGNEQQLSAAESTIRAALKPHNLPAKAINYDVDSVY